jgi:hypothetical protein
MINNRFNVVYHLLYSVIFLIILNGTENRFFINI